MMKEIFGKRLRQARKMRCMTMSELAEKIGISKQAISKYEAGKMGPDSDILCKIARALNVTKDYFFHPQNVNVEFLAFRAKDSLNVKNKAALEEAVKNRIEKDIDIKDVLGLKYQFESCDYPYSPKNSEEAMDCAKNLRTKWGVGDMGISKVINLLENKGIIVIEVDYPDSFDGVCGFANTNIPFIVINKNQMAERKRFTLMHELGHLLLNVDSLFSQKEQEKICNVFAGEMLIPSHRFVEALGKKRKEIPLAELIPLQEEYGISVDALIHKAKETGVISQRKYDGYWAQKKALPEFKAIVETSRIKDEKPQLFNACVHRALALEAITLSKAAEYLEVPQYDLMYNLNWTLRWS